MKLTKGEKYDVTTLVLVDWLNGDSDTDNTYHLDSYFAPDGTYLGPDEYGVEPIVVTRPRPTKLFLVKVLTPIDPMV